jgi:hypothetical protein
MTMEGSGGPEGSLGASRFLELFQNLFFLFTGDERLSSGALFRNEAINAIQIEGFDNLLHRTIGKIKGTHCLFPGAARQKQNNDRTSAIGFPVTGTLSRIQIAQ